MVDVQHLRLTCAFLSLHLAALATTRAVATGETQGNLLLQVAKRLGTRSARLSEIMNKQPNSTPEACRACVNAEDELVANLTALTSVQTQLSEIQDAVQNATSSYASCTKELMHTGSAVASTKKVVTDKHRSLGEHLSADDAATAVSIFSSKGTDGTNIFQAQLMAWEAAVDNHAKKQAECATINSHKESVAASLHQKQQAVANATAAKDVAQEAALAACKAVHGEPTPAPKPAPTPVPTPPGIWEVYSLGFEGSGTDITDADAGAEKLDFKFRPKGSLSSLQSKSGLSSLRCGGDVESGGSIGKVDFGKSDFILEFWVMMEKIGHQYNGLFSSMGANTDYTKSGIGMRLDFWALGANFNRDCFSGNPPWKEFTPMKWHHVKIQRIGAKESQFFDGRLLGSEVSCAHIDLTSPRGEFCTFWSSTSTSGRKNSMYETTGWIDDLRIMRRTDAA